MLHHADSRLGFALDADDERAIVHSIYLFGPDGEMLEFAAETPRMYRGGAEERVRHEPGFEPYLAPSANL